MKKLLLTTGAILLAAFLMVTITACSTNKAPQTNELSKISIGIPTAPGMALIMVAQDKGFFEANGLEVTLQEFTAGKFALQAFLGGSLDYVASGELPVVFSTMQGNNFVVPAQLVNKTKNAVRVIARKDGDQTTAKNYFTATKRKLATSFGGGPEFFVHEFLEKIDIEDENIELISMKPADMPAALSNGSIDAVAIFDPFAYFAEQQLGDQGITFFEDDLPSEIYVLNAQKSVKNNFSDLTKLMKGLLDAEKFIEEHPNEAKTIVTKYTKLDKKVLDEIWSNFDFRLALTTELINLWDKEAKWAKDTNKVTPDATIPNFQNIIFQEPLKKISPNSVSLP